MEDGLLNLIFCFLSARAVYSIRGTEAFTVCADAPVEYKEFLCCFPKQFYRS